jgi:predicted ester cyclase
MSSKLAENRRVVRRIYGELWNQGNLAVAEQIFARPESVQRYVGAFLAAFPDLVHTVDEMVAEGDKVVACFTAQGTHTGMWYGTAATGKAIHYSGVTIARLSEGKIIEHRTVWDTLAVLEQLGLVPAIRKEDGTRP